MSTRRLTVLGVAFAFLAALLLAPTTTPGASAAGTRHTGWAPAAKATITPGTMMYTKGAQCTANFVFTDAVGGVYVGYAAHCAGKGAATDTNGCNTASHPNGTPVRFARGGNLASGGSTVGTGTLVYSSWRAMRRLGTRNADACAYNDFALVKVAPRFVRRVNPSVPFWGGPTGIDRNGTDAGDRLWTYGNSSLRGGVEPLAPHTGVSVGDDPADGGWSHPLYTVSPGIPGDSGSGFLSAGGKAVGTLSTIGLLPLPASNNIGDLAKELAFAQQHSGIRGLRLTLGTMKFDPVV